MLFVGYSGSFQLDCSVRKAIYTLEDSEYIAWCDAIRKRVVNKNFVWLLWNTVARTRILGQSNFQPVILQSLSFHISTLTTCSSHLLKKMPNLAKTVAFWTLKILLAVMAFLVSAVAANTLLSYILPRIFAEARRKDIYEMPSLETWVIVGKHGLTFLVSAWAGVFTGQYFSEPRLQERSPAAKLESKDKKDRPFPSLWQKMQWKNGNEEEGGAEAINSFESHTESYIPPQTPSTPTVDPIIQDWTIYRYFGKLPPLALNAINDEGDGLSQSLANDASQWNPELCDRYDPKNWLSLRAFC